MDGTHISISKPRESPTAYFYFKSRGYSLNCQTVVDSNKRFLDLFFGMLGSTNDLRVLRRSTLYHRGMHVSLWDSTLSFQGFSPYLLANSGYLLLPWVMVPHRGFGNLPLVDTLFNRKLCQGHGVVENAFGILKQTFRELLGKSELLVTFLPDVIICCAILHNMLLDQSHQEVERLLQVLRTEGLPDPNADEAMVVDVDEGGPDDVQLPGGAEKRRQLGVFLALQRNMAL